MLCHFSRVQLSVACQVPLSIGFPRQEYWSGLPFPSPGDVPHPGMNPGIGPASLMSLALSSHLHNQSMGTAYMQTKQENEQMMCKCMANNHEKVFSLQPSGKCKF